jgi:hypothetical protein
VPIQLFLERNHSFGPDAIMSARRGGSRPCGSGSNGLCGPASTASLERRQHQMNDIVALFLVPKFIVGAL